MLEDPPLLTIRRAFPRPEAGALARLAGVPTGNLVDAMDGRGALDWQIKPVLPARAVFCGTALTCHVGPSDNLAIFGALHEAQPGDVIIAAADSFTGTAIVGDVVCGLARNRGLAGIVTDGLVRDLAGIAKVGLPVAARGVTPNSCVRSGPGTVGFPVVVGGVAVASGDIVVGDADGVVIVPRERIAAVLTRLDAIRTAEAATEARIEAGLKIPDWVEPLFASGRVRVVE